jgi:ceramide glucosyltransferase
MAPHWTLLAAPLAGYALTSAVAGYAVFAALMSRRPLLAQQPAACHPRASGDPYSASPVTVLKPLRGAEPRLYDNLATLCRQQHPAFQIVFGVHNADDPALAVVRRLQSDFPDCDIALAISPEQHGSNGKVSNLINMLPLARYDKLVLADSDIAVPPGYLTHVTAPLADPAVGVVTCLYRGHALSGFWPALGAQFINDWFAPSVRVAHAGGSSSFAFGATIALRRDALAAIGGFETLANRLADDYWLGELTRRIGLRTVLSDVMVGTDVAEGTLAELWTHELRWLRTIRSLNPAGFAFTFITFTWPLLLLGLLLAPQPAALAIACIGLLARSALAGRGGGAGAMLRAPLRDLLLLAEWAAALFGTHVRWHGQRMAVKDQLAASTSDHPLPPSQSTPGMRPHRTTP